ncbi:MAG: hypothetical protein KatS3mg035_2091 [Bacteroidia bacterium]|nr:MAG: hypothetical protein KatS3mg035_2091 [Bacteroidia bacterium]
MKDIKKVGAYQVCLPSILRVDELEAIWREIGFTDICFVNHTKNILPSSKRMSEHAQMRILQGNPGSEILKISRKAPISCNQAIESGVIGYLPKEENRETKVLKTLGKLIN